MKRINLEIWRNENLKGRRPSLICSLAFVILVMFSCEDGVPKKKLDNFTSGSIKIGVDASLSQFAEAEIVGFKANYPKGEIIAFSGTEDSIIKQFMLDSFRAIMTTRELLPSENNFFKKKGYITKTTRIATDAIAFIVNKNNPNDSMTYDSLEAIIKGEPNGGIKHVSLQMQVVFENPNSSMIKSLQKEFGLSTSIPAHWSSLNSSQEIIDFVQKNPNAIGIIGVNWLSNHTDIQTMKFLNEISVVAVSRKEDQKGMRYRPWQAYMVQNLYPFLRDVYLISNENRAALGTSFVTFAASDKGQYVALKMGLSPARMPAREIQIKKGF